MISRSIAAVDRTNYLAENGHHLAIPVLDVRPPSIGDGLADGIVSLLEADRTVPEFVGAFKTRDHPRWTVRATISG